MANKRRDKTGQKKKNRKEYVHFEQLKFLERVCQTTPRKPVELKEENSEEDFPLIETIISSPDHEESSLTEFASSSSRFGKRNFQDIDHDNWENGNLIEYPRRFQDEDSDRQFLLSLVPDLKSVPANKKSKLKSDILAAIVAAQTNQEPPKPNLGSFPFQNQQFPMCFVPLNCVPSGAKLQSNQAVSNKTEQSND